MKNTASTIDATLLALVLNPHAIKQAPMNEEPRYPAGNVSQDMPPDMDVTPPSSASSHKLARVELRGKDVRSSSIECMCAQVRTPMNAWLIYRRSMSKFLEAWCTPTSWNPTVSNLADPKVSSDCLKEIFMRVLERIYCMMN